MSDVDEPGATSRRLCGGGSSTGSQSDDDAIDDLNGRAPLLGGTSSSPHEVRIDLTDKPASPHDRFPKERRKTVLACITLFIAAFMNDLTLSFVHEWVPETPPLPDVGFRHTTYYAMGLNYCEYLMLGSFGSVLLLILFHRHRWIVLRRLAFIGALLYGLRCVTMFVTQLPVADPNYYCSPKLGPNATFWQLAERALEIAAGVGLKLYGKHTLCGDYIYSGHTIVLTTSALFMNEYSPRRWRPLHILSWLIAFAGMILLIISRGHYTIDVILSYFICTRIFWIYHTMAAHPTLKISPHNHLTKEFWFYPFHYMEASIHKPVPRRFDFPLPLPRNFLQYLRRRKSNLQ